MLSIWQLVLAAQGLTAIVSYLVRPKVALNRHFCNVAENLHASWLTAS